MSLTVDGVWKANKWAPTVWASGVWAEGSTRVTKGGGPIEDVDWKRLQRLRRQQSVILDDEEALAIIIAEMTRRR